MSDALGDIVGNLDVEHKARCAGRQGRERVFGFMKGFERIVSIRWTGREFGNGYSRRGTLPSVGSDTFEGWYC